MKLLGVAQPPPVLLGVPVAAAALIVGWQSAERPLLVVAAAMAFWFVIVAISNLLAGLIVFTIVTFPEQLPSLPVATVAKPLGAILVVSWLLLLASRRRDIPFISHDRPGLTAVLAAFIAWAACSTLWATDAGVAISNLTRLVQVAVLLVIAYSAVRSARDLRLLVSGYLVAASATALYALFRGGLTEERLTGGITNANAFAALLLVAMVLASFMLAATDRLGARLALVACLAACTPAFVLTQSRGGLAGLGVALIASIAVAGPLRPRVVASVLVVAALGVGYYGLAAPEAVTERIADVSAEGSSGRADEWRIALRMFADHPLGGAGLGNFGVLEPSYASESIDLLRVGYVLRGFRAHNTYLEVLSELGIVGMALLAAVIIGVARAASQGIDMLSKSGDVGTEIIARGMTAAVASLLAAYVFASAQYEKQPWLLLGVLAALPRLARSAGREAGDEIVPQLPSSPSSNRTPPAHRAAS